MPNDKRPASDEASSYYFTYIDRVAGDDVVSALEAQLEEAVELFSPLSEESSSFRYAAGKWSIRETLGHVNDAERLFLFRAFWFSRGFESPLPSFDQNTAVAAARSGERSWRSHVEEFRAVRAATVAFFRNLPDEAWSRGGKASDNFFTVRAFAFIIAGHFVHHAGILRERYLAELASSR